MQIPLSEWFDRLADLCGYASRDELIAEQGACCWMPFYEDGLTPGEAYTADADHAQ